MRLIRSLFLLAAYVSVVVFGVLTLASFDALDYEAGALCLALTAGAVWAVLKGERALDEQWAQGN